MPSSSARRLALSCCFLVAGAAVALADPSAAPPGIPPGPVPADSPEPPAPHLEQPRSTDPDTVSDQSARLELARVLSYSKKFDESAAEYRKVLAKEPGNTKARIELATVLTYQKKSEDALALLKGVNVDALDPDSQLLMADLYRAQKEYGPAEKLYRRALERDARDQTVRLKLAAMLSWMRRYDESLAEYRKVLEARPDDEQVRRRYAFVLAWSGRHAEAAAELKKTLPGGK